MILLADSGQNVIVLASAANFELMPQDLEPLRDVFAEADLVMSQLEVPLETVGAAMRLSRDTGAFSILDIGSAQPLEDELLASADLVSPNETEAEALTGIVVDSLETAREAAQHLHNAGVSHVVMKLGARGCLYYGEAEELYVPAFKVDAVDTTAAGDAFTAALGVAWDTMPLADALRFANAAGALAATVEGAQPSMPTLEATLHFLDSAEQ